MSALGLRGGVPAVFRDDVLHTTVTHHRFGHVINGLVIRNAGANILRVFFREEDAAAAGGTDYVELQAYALTEPFGTWEGPVEIREIWMTSTVGTTTVEMVSFQRRG